MIQDIYTKVTKREKTKVEKAEKILEWAKAVELKKENIKITAYKKL